MKYSREDLETFKYVTSMPEMTSQDKIMVGIIEDLEDLYTSIKALANQYETQGRVAEAQEVRRLVNAPD